MKKQINCTLLSAALLAAQSVSAAPPAAPSLGWFADSYDDGSAVTAAWDMWWGENGSSWKLIDNDAEVCSGTLTINGQNAQSGSCTSSYSPGSHSLTVKLCNTDGCTSSSESRFFVAGGTANIAPTVSLSLPAQADINTVVQLQATAADNDGYISSVLFYQGTTLLGSDNSAPYSYEYTPTAIGTIDFKAVANDNLSAQATAAAQLQVVDPSGGDTANGENLTLSKLPLQVDLNIDTDKTYLFDEKISSLSSRKNGQISSWVIDGQAVTLSGKLAGRTGLKITTESGKSYYMGLRVNHSDGSLPGLPKYLSIGSVSEDSTPDLDFWKDIDTDLTNKNMDIRYIYINGGPSGDNFWQGWQSWSEKRAGRFAKESLRLGLIPFFVYYNIADGGESFETDLNHTRDPLYMHDYFQDLNVFMDQVQEELQGELYGIILEPDYLGYMQQGGELHLGTNDPTQISTAVAADAISAEAGTIRSMVERINKTINEKRLEGHNIFYGWQLNLWAYSPTSGSKGVLRRTDENDLGWAAGRAAIDEGARKTTQYGIDAGILTHGADFVSIDKYGLDAMIHQNRQDPSDSTWFWNNDHWQNYLQFVSIMKQTADKPIILWQLPVGHINGSTSVSAYTGQAFPILDNSDTKGEDSTTSYFFGDTFESGDSLRLPYFSRNNTNDSKLSVSGTQITWGSHMQEVRDAGVIAALFGAGVGASTDGVGSPATDSYFWIQKVQSYYADGTVPLDKEYGTGGYVCGLSCGPYAAFTDLINGSEIRLPALTKVTINAQASDADGSVVSLNLEVNGQVVSQLTRTGTTDNFSGSWLPDAFTTYTLTLHATDNDGLSSTRQVSVDIVKEGTCTVQPWDADTIYASAGTQVSFAGFIYENKYYITGEAPDPAGPAWGVWTAVGPCN
ncbi:Ig-like domain-containing protein [Psychromonas aquimarina]|uniref:Ig-like domain-containing protein n=1 Tax=Psychromonas aquimarina TaxID=444919 RepID=UPI0003F6CCD4|nr:Ig-like domain-containing protein [Psychromonas aquimarina]